MKKEEVKSLVGLLASLDWKKILYHAINNEVFSSSWNKNAVREWRNASDSIYCSIISHIRESGIDPYNSKVKIVHYAQTKRRVDN